MKDNYNFLSKNKIAVFLLLFIPLLQSCGGKCDPPPPIGVADILPAAQYNIDTDIYIDGTLSMQGFTNEKGVLTHYQQTIPILERIAGGKVTFWKFGNNPKAIDRMEYLKADKSEFYPNTPDLQETRIQNVIEQSDASHLTVIVTDLFQEFSDVNQLISLIRGKYTRKNVAVGLLGVKSQFNGKVMDVGTHDWDFNYSSGSDPGRFRPFYILVFGSQRNISDYFDKFDAESVNFNTFDNQETGFKIKNRLILSRYLVEEPVSLIDAKITPNNQVARMAPGILLKTSSPKNPFKEFTVPGTADGEAFTAEIPISLLNHTIDFGSELTAEIDPSFCGAKAISPVTDMPVSIEASTSDKKKIVLKVNVVGRKLDSKATNGFRIILRPKVYNPPQWAKDWNMTGEEIEQWGQNPADFNGAKTHNLTQFLNSLWNATEDEFHPKLAEFYCYFKRS